jgi:hypothetical protein
MGSNNLISSEEETLRRLANGGALIAVEPEYNSVPGCDGGQCDIMNASTTKSQAITTGKAAVIGAMVRAKWWKEEGDRRQEEDDV